MAREGLCEVTSELRPEGSEGTRLAEEHSSCAEALRNVHVVCPGENREAVWPGSVSVRRILGENIKRY